MSLIEKGSKALVTSNKSLFNLAKKKVPGFSVTKFNDISRHGMVKQWVALNAGLFGIYLVGSGPVGHMYRNYLTLESNSSVLAIPTCHFGHTSLAALLFNSGVMWTLGNNHVRKYGCSKFAAVIGVSCGLASVAGLATVQAEDREVIAGGMAASAGLITYNVFKNPAWFAYFRFNPLLGLIALTTYGVYNKDVACLGGISGGYLAMILAL